MPIKTKPTICYPFEHMEVGDSFFVPVYDVKEILEEIGAVAAALQVQVKIKSGIEHGLYGVRVWRVK